MVAAKATRMRGGVYASNAQIDAVAAASFSLTSAAATGSSLPDEDAEDIAHPLLAVAQSNLEGNQWGGVVSLIDANSYEQLCAFQLASGVSSLAWCGVDGNVLALACDNGDVQLVRASQIDGDFAFLPQSGGGRAIDGDDGGDAEEEVSSFAAGWGHDDVVTSVSASLFEKTKIATGSWDLTVKLWDISCMDKTIATLEGHTDLIWSVVMNHKSAYLLASASQDCTVQIWDNRQPTDAVQVISTEFPALVVDWHPHNESIFSVGLEDGSVITFDTRSPTTPLFESTPHDGPVHALKYSRFHEDLLASGGDDASVFVRNGSQAPSRVDTDHSDYVRALEWFQVPAPASSSSSTVLATASWDKTMRMWSVEDRQQQQVDL